MKKRLIKKHGRKNKAKIERPQDHQEVRHQE